MITAVCLLVSMLLGAQPLDPFQPPIPTSPFGAPSFSGDLSDGRGLGTGFQVDFPLFYGASMRFWFYDLDLFGVEVIAFGSEDYHEEFFEATVRGLGKFFDSRVTDFYVAVGLTYKYYMLIPHVALGMEISVSNETAFNLEAGVGVYGNSTIPFLGGGMHFYF